jgi:hypothetical protein
MKQLIMTIIRGTEDRQLSTALQFTIDAYYQDYAARGSPSNRSLTITVEQINQSIVLNDNDDNRG